MSDTDEVNLKITSEKGLEGKQQCDDENLGSKKSNCKNKELNTVESTEANTVTSEICCGKSDNDASVEGQSKSDSDRENSKECSDVDKSSVTYEGDKCVYVDPNTKCRYIWDGDKNDWIAERLLQRQPDFSDKSGDYKFDGTTYRYTDKNSGVEYKWVIDKNEWIAVEKKDNGDGKSASADKEAAAPSIEDGNDKKNSVEPATVGGGGVYGYENDRHTYTDPVDKTVYIWDREKRAWFPKVDDDFLAQYQMNYGFVDPNKDDSSKNEKSDQAKLFAKVGQTKDAAGEKRKAQQQEPTWFEVDDDSNTKVYVSNLPLDITEKEFVDVMQKCGLVMKDANTNKMKVKLYTEQGSNQLKGDGLCTYIKKESVELALNLLDGYEVKGQKLRVERARFTMKGNAYDPSLKPKKRKRKDKEKLKKMQEKLFDWRPDKLRGERSRNESVVIVKNLFEPGIFDKDVKLILEFQQDLREECQKLGAVKRVIIYDRHPEGVGQINFKEPEAADACVQLLHGRWFNKRKITAETWDGKTKYKIVETEEQLKKRMDKWDTYLETEEEKEKKRIEKEKEEEENVAKEKEKREEAEDGSKSEERDSDAETKSSLGSDCVTDEELD